MKDGQYGRDQRDYISFGRSGFNRKSQYRDTDGSFTGTDKNSQELGRIPGPNRYGEESIRHDSYQDDQFKNNYDPTYQDEYGIKHPYEHGGPFNRWSDDIRSESSRENHFGKGPKGYQRSPDRIREEACEILTHNGDLDASEIEVLIKDRHIILQGEVQSRYEKKLAEDLVENISGIEDVYNQINVMKSVDGWIPGVGKASIEKGSGGPNEQR